MEHLKDETFGDKRILKGNSLQSLVAMTEKVLIPMRGNGRGMVSRRRAMRNFVRNMKEFEMGLEFNRKPMEVMK